LDHCRYAESLAALSDHSSLNALKRSTIEHKVPAHLPPVNRDGSGNITGMVKTDFFGKFTVFTGPLGKLTARDTLRYFDI
jgi:hypothetical protein